MAAVEDQLPRADIESQAEIFQFTVPTHLPDVAPFKLEIIQVNLQERWFNSDLKASRANHLAGLLGFGGLVGIGEAASIPDKTAMISTVSLSLLGIGSALYKSYRHDALRIREKYSATE